MANKALHYGDSGKSIITDITQFPHPKDIPNVNEYTGNSHSWKPTQLSMVFAHFDTNKIVILWKPHVQKITTYYKSIHSKVK